MKCSAVQCNTVQYNAIQCSYLTLQRHLCSAAYLPGRGQLKETPAIRWDCQVCTVHCTALHCTARYVVWSSCNVEYSSVGDGTVRNGTFLLLSPVRMTLFIWPTRALTRLAGQWLPRPNTASHHGQTVWSWFGLTNSLTGQYTDVYDCPRRPTADTSFLPVLGGWSMWER